MSVYLHDTVCPQHFVVNHRRQMWVFVLLPLIISQDPVLIFSHDLYLEQLIVEF